MSKEDKVRENEVIVEVYMAMQNAPEIYDLFIPRNGNLRPNRLAQPMPGIIQVVMAGMNPTAPQQLCLADQFSTDKRFRVLKFY